MKRILVIAAALSAVTTASAAQNTIGNVTDNRGIVAQVAPVKQDAAAAMNPLGLTINDCIGILNGLNALDRTLPGDAAAGGGAPVYQFERAGLRLDMAHNIAVLTAVQREAQVAQQRIFQDVLKTMPPKEDGKPATEIPQGTEQAVEYDRRLRQLVDRPCGADVTRINAADLNLEKNGIPLGVLSLLDKVLVR